MLKSALIIYDLKAPKKMLQQLNRLKKRACGSMEKGITVRSRASDTVRGDQVQHNSIMFPDIRERLAHGGLLPVSSP